MVEPGFDLQSLLATAEQQNPNLRALRAQENAAGAQVTAARMQYFPTLSVSAGWSGFTQEFSNEQLLIDQELSRAKAGYAGCLESNQIRSSAGLPTVDCLGANNLVDPATLDPAVAASIREQNNVFPFHFSRQPFSASLRISLPIFDGFSRELNLSQQRAQQEDAQEAVRANRLLVRKNVEADYLRVQTAYSSIAVQQAARDAARDQLRLAEDRYRLGSGTALELSDAQNAVQGAEGAYVNAVYGYHIAVAQLELAVGRPLR